MSIPPQTGAGGLVNTQNLLQQVLSVSGTGGGGMVPPGSTGIGVFSTAGVSGPAVYVPASGALNIPNYSPVPAGSTGITALTTSGVSGPSTYNPSTGALNIPVYAWGTPNFQQSSLTANYSTSSATPTAIGGGTGILIAANFNPCIVLSFFQLVTSTGTNPIPVINIIRGTESLPPAAGAVIPGPDTPILETRLVTTAGVISGSVIDPNITVGVTYCYYLAMWVAYGTSPVSTANSGITNSSLSALELK